MQKKLHGLFPILLTPFKNNLEVDYSALNKLVDYYKMSGVDGITCLGEVSEVDFLNDEEKNSILKTVLNALKGEMPVIAGCGRGSLEPTSAAIADAFKMGVSAALVPPPKNAKMLPDEIYAYYMQLDRKAGGPIIILDNPSLGYPLIPVEIISRLEDDSSHIRGIKVEEQPTILKIASLRREVKADLSIYGASHGRNLYWEMERTIDGVITSAPIPSQMLSVWKLFHEAKRDKAYEAFLSSLPLAYFLQEKPVSVKKEILRHLGIFPNNIVRKKGDSLNSDVARDLDALVDWTINRFNSLS